MAAKTFIIFDNQVNIGRFIAPSDLRHEGNIFNFLRLIFASAVIFSHAFVLTDYVDPSVSLLPFSTGKFAVLLFFSLSGFLVTNSLQTRGIWYFARARALRMLPGLWVMLILTAVITYIFFSSNSVSYLLHDSNFWGYIWKNGLFIGHVYGIDSVFTNNPFPMVVNGSLWTIQREVQCYILLGMAGAVGLLKRNRTLLAIFFCSLMLHLALPSSWLPQIEDSRPLMVSFFAGVVLYIFRDRVFLSWIFVLLSILITLFIDRGPFQSLVAQLSVAYLALVSAILVPSSWKRLSYLMPDYSFGIYIYAFFIQQALVATGVADTPYANMCLTLILTLPFAALSWHYVEKPALALKAPGGQRVEVADRAPSG